MEEFPEYDDDLAGLDGLDQPSIIENENEGDRSSEGS